MKVNLSELVQEIQGRYHVLSREFQDCCISGIELVEKYDPQSWSDENTLHVVRLRSLSLITPQPVRVPVLCVVPPGNYMTPFKPFLGSGSFVVVVADSFDKFLISLSDTLYRCGQRSSALDEFSKQLLLCRTLDEVLETGGQWLKNPIVVVDEHQSILACTESAFLARPEDNNNLFAVKTLFSRSESVTAMLEAMEASMRSSWPVMGTADVPFICKVMVENGRTEGAVLFCAFERDLSETDISFAEVFANYCALLIRELTVQKASKSKTDPLGYLLQMLLTETNVSRDEIEKYIDQMHSAMKRYRYVLSVVPAEEMPTVHTPVHRLLDILRGVVPGTYGAYYRNKLTLVIEWGERIRDFEKAWPKLVEVLREHQMCAGVSNACSDILSIRDYFRQAQNAEEIGRRMKTEGVLFPYYQCVPQHMLELASTYEDPVHFCDPGVLELYKNDQENKTELLRTLQVYLDCGQNKARTARELFLHTNTVKYRLAQINDYVSLLNMTREDELRLHLSLLALNYIREKRESGA